MTDGVSEDVDELGTPVCPRCLASMEIAGSDETPRWECPDCGFVRLS